MNERLRRVVLIDNVPGTVSRKRLEELVTLWPKRIRAPGTERGSLFFDSDQGEACET